MVGSSSRFWIGVLTGCVVVSAVAARLLAQSDENPEKPIEVLRQERYIEAQQKNFVYRMENEQYNLALDIAMHLHDLDPQGGISAFNAARVLSQIGDSDRALEWLQIAIESGFSRTEMLEGDRALLNVRARPQFAIIVEGSEANRHAEFETIKEVFDQTPLFSFIPPNYDEKTPAPLIIALHGKGADAADYFEPWTNIAINRGSILAAPNGPRPLGEGFDWTYPDESQWIVNRTIDRLLEEGKAIDTSRIILTGFDSGATAAYAIALSAPHEIHGVIPIGGGYPLSAIEAPNDLEKGEWPSFYFLSGENDGLRMSAQGAASMLRELGFQVESVVFPNTGHSLPEDYESYLFKAVDWVLEH